MSSTGRRSVWDRIAARPSERRPRARVIGPTVTADSEANLLTDPRAGDSGRNNRGFPRRSYRGGSVCVSRDVTVAPPALIEAPADAGNGFARLTTLEPRAAAVPPGRKRDARAAELDEIAEEESHCPICHEGWNVNEYPIVKP